MLLSGNAMVAMLIDEMHTDEIAPDFYNNEQALRSVVKMAYLSGIDYYFKIEELPTGVGINYDVNTKHHSCRIEEYRLHRQQ